MLEICMEMRYTYLLQHFNIYFQVVGRETLLYLIAILCKNYGTNVYLTKLVDTTRIHIMPSMNPDGLYYYRYINIHVLQVMNVVFQAIVSDIRLQLSIRHYYVIV